MLYYYLCTGMCIEWMLAAASSSWSSSSLSSSSLASFSTCTGMPDESNSDNEVFLSNAEEKRAFEKECAATDALIQIGGMLLDAVQMLHESHAVRSQQLYRVADALARPRLIPDARRKLRCLVDRQVRAFLLMEAFLFITSPWYMERPVGSHHSWASESTSRLFCFCIHILTLFSNP